MMRTMREIVMSNWSEFVQRVDELEGWAFRGESEAAWPLQTALARRLSAYCPDKTLWPLRETRALRVFRRKGHIYLNDSSTLRDDLRTLALMQHHGAPTRLLDFTKSAFVAAFFALESALGDSAVYALNTPLLWGLAPAFNPALTRDRIDPRVPGHFDKYFVNNEFPVVWVGEPLEMDRRLIAQSGLFVIPGQIDRPLSEVLDSYQTDAELLVKYVLPQPIRDEAMKSLYRMNITQATLLPDLEGLARASAYELEVVWESLVEDFRKQARPR
ncbi:MAG: FRG domain-containing protein [Betaproteobacteria bacterium]|jgi:hypothetical protein